MGWSKTLSSASIHSKFIQNGFIELYLPYNGNTDDKVIEILCPDLAPAKKGVFFFGKSDEARDTMNASAALECHQQRFKIYVNDSLIQDINYRFFDHVKRKNKGLTAILDVSNLHRGEHKLKINALMPRKAER